MKNKIIVLIIFVIILVVFLYKVVFVHHNKINIEAASAFYPFTSSLMQDIYEQSDMVKLVSTTQAYKHIINEMEKRILL